MQDVFKKLNSSALRRIKRNQGNQKIDIYIIHTNFSFFYVLFTASLAFSLQVKKICKKCLRTS